ncbi:hypothetical protein C8J56DRAFT_50659 [Mycena floridula]|nr:hypothetical protein C8J56DRAFT_50659 [Mycena floridula]
MGVFSDTTHKEITYRFGPLMVGVFFSTMLYGVNVVQAFTYHETSKKDSRWLRVMVLLLFLLVTVHTALNMLIVYQPLVQHFGQTEVLGQPPLYLRFDPILGGMISTPIQIFMAWRIMVITQTRLWFCIIAGTALISLGGSTWTTVFALLRSSFSEFSQSLASRAAPMTWLLSSAICDTLITGVLVHSLHVRKSGLNTPLNAYVNHIIYLTIQTGALTTLFAVTAAFVFLILKDSTISFSWDLSLSRLYLMTILSSLNARDVWKNGGDNALYPSIGVIHQSPVGTIQSPPHSGTEMQTISQLLKG